ncbi:uncharacterized protein LOC127789322 isoform X2 [Diospyros lotus]|uniref:uncharacterized protein LOC127789322 isoform X2 n=1 Tax=Diospyros lotus TaxID=55363 RepID=UPI00224CF3F7|nr:uncharacterized protein LOC127789322 isoform X2 [Diospyros lotus]
MNRAARPTLLNSEANSFSLRVALFHSTPFLDRRRRTHWDSGEGGYRDSSRSYNQYSKRLRRFRAKQTLLRNVSSFAELMFQSWKNGFDEHDRSSSQGSSWFRCEFGPKGSKGGWTGVNGSNSTGRRAPRFCEDDDDTETIFRSGFGGNRYFYWSFIDEEEEFPRWRNSSGYSNNHRNSWNWRYQDEEDYDSSTESDSSGPDTVSDRLALGLRASGPLKMEDVKNAYRACAMKWHPDRHHGSSKINSLLSASTGCCRGKI